MDRSVHNITNYESLMTPQERSALRQLVLQAKVKHADSPVMKKALIDKWGSDDPQVAALSRWVGNRSCRWFTTESCATILAK